MSQAIQLHPRGEQRRFARVDSELPVKFRYGSTETSVAETADICRGGVCIHSGRYFRPGTRLVVSLAGDTPELNADVIWCRPSRESGGFWMGLRVVYDEAAVWSTMSSLLHQSLETSGALARPGCFGNCGEIGIGWSYTESSTVRDEAPLRA
ncbi:MAG: PilZ domain-containing protein [Candidatus Hydrogenedentes bacterium]|nr:PilZ domain-containing protein [Candidatus Hydrogenedentota bacterium]